MEFFRLGSRFGRSPRRARPQRRRQLVVELLEDRTLMSAGPAAGVELLGKPTPAPQYQWDMVKISAPTAWNTTLGSAKVVVADIDTGIDYTHPDLYLNVWINQGEVPSGVVDTDGDGRITFYDLNAPANAGMVTDFNHTGYIDGGDLLADPRWANHVDNDGNGFVDDIIGWNFVTNTNDPMDDNGHGSHTAGTIGALHNGIGNGVDGVNGKVQIMPLKAFDADGGGATYDIALARATAGIYYSANNGAQVSNNSWGVYGFGDTQDGTGGPASHQALYNAIKDTPNVLFVSSAGNNGVNNDSSVYANFPSSYNLPNIIAVAATSSNDQKPYWSNYGSTTVDLGAPGNNVVSTVPGGYASYSGTSMASPHVAGAAALLLAKNDTLSVADVKTAILTNVDVVSSMSRTVSQGRLDVAKALASVTFVSGGSSAASDSGASSPDSSTPTGKGKKGSLTQGQFDVTPIDDLATLNQKSTTPISVSSGNGFPLAATPNFLMTNAPAQPGSQAQSWLAAGSFTDDPIHTPQVPEVVPPNGEVNPISLAPAGRSPGAPSATHIVTQVFGPAPNVASPAPTDDTPALPPVSPASTTVDAPVPSGFGAEMLSNTASKIFSLAGAALFFVNGAFLSKSRDRVAEEKRERRPAL